MNKIGNIKVVNVIEQVGLEVVSVTSFPDTEEGNKAADLFFYDLIKGDGGDLSGKSCEKYAKDARYVNGHYIVTSIISLTEQ